MPRARRLILVVAIAAASATASAQGQGDDADAKRAASRLLEEGLERVQAQDYAAALARFEAAYKILPNPKIFLNIANAQKGLDRDPEAAEAYEQFLHSVRDADAVSPEKMKFARDELDALRAQLGRIVFSLEPHDTTLVLDGRPHDVLSGIPVYVRPGAHEISLNASGREARGLRIEIAAGEERKVEVALQAPVAGAVISTPSADPAPRRILPWIAVGGAVTLAAVGAAFGLHARGAYSDYEESLEQTDFDRASREGTIANVLFVGAGVCALTAGALFLFTGHTQAASTTGVAIAVGPDDAWSFHFRGPF